jgi:hypothetical protein
VCAQLREYREVKYNKFLTIRGWMLMSKIRAISDDFTIDLTGGILEPIYKYLFEDNTVMLALRNDEIHLYYRGGVIQKIVRTSKGYQCSVDKNYFKDGDSLTTSGVKARVINCLEDSVALLQEFPTIKLAIDRHLSKIRKEEREYQQLVVRENNQSSISGETEYFITDIEFSMPNGLEGGRFDMLGVRWDANNRKYGNKCIPVIFEMKYGDKALSNKSGIVDHLQKLVKVLKEDPDFKNKISQVIESQFNSFNDLELISFSRNKEGGNIAFVPSSRIEYVLLLANTNPRSTTLSDIILSQEFRAAVDCLEVSGLDVRFFVASYAGYGLHVGCMKTTEQMLKYSQLESIS